MQFTEANNDLPKIYVLVDERIVTIRSFLLDDGFSSDEISFSAPAITDKSAQQYGNNVGSPFRYSAEQTVTVYSENIDKVREVSRQLSDLGKKGIAFNGNHYQAQTEYFFTKLNQVKPAMIEEATRQARAVAEKFAEDSERMLGKIKRASQGESSISDRDKDNPHIKKVRVVSTVEYYLYD
ncbi:SIMPL domain-containing protein [Zhongshania sp.]|uniref:SIMPL domain-containing protein n=1 Tax=Zhongshania sp. TaxID=1971902 RepID=UPI0039E71930